MILEKYLSVLQVAGQLDVNPETVRRWIREGTLGAEMVAGAWFVDKDVLAAFVPPSLRLRKRETNGS